MRRTLPLASLILIFGFATVPAAFATNYYIAANGSDSNNGTSKTTPWLHAPGMANCASACASANPAAGDQFFLRGGDTWTISAAWTFSWSGTSVNQIYLGVDQTWYTGSSWARPIISGGGSFPGAAGTGAFLMLGIGSQSYVTVDNLEWTGLNWSTSITGLVGYIGLGGNSANILIKNNYFHGWTHGSGRENNSAEVVACGGGSSISNQFFLNVVDGSDTTMDSFMGIEGACVGYVYENEFKELMYGFNGNAKSIHDNVFDHVGFASYDGVSHNGVVISNSDDSGGFLFYNNVVLTDLPGQNGGVPIWQTPLLNETSYAFNNIFPNVDNLTGTALWCMNYYASGGPSGGSCTWFNNTIESGLDNAPPNNVGFRYGGQQGVPPAAINQYNQHAITGVGTTPASLGFNSTGCNGVNTCVLTATNFVIQTKATANAQGYTLGQTYPFSPTASNNSTVGAGVNETALCANISSIDANAGAACLNDTTYAVLYNTGTHTVTYPARTPVARPASGSWDIGAYQFVNNAPQAPAGLVAVVH